MKTEVTQTLNITQADDPTFLSSGIYLVIGVFEYEKNAQRMVKTAARQGLEAEYKLYPHNGYFYVFTSSSEDTTKILEDYSTVRSSTTFSDAWVLMVDGKNEPIPEEADNFQQVQGDIEENQKILFSEDSSVQEENFVAEPSETPEEKNPVLVVKTRNELDGSLVEASIELVDGLRAKLINKLDAGTPWLVENKEQFDTIQVISEAIGYRKMQLEYIPNNPINDTTALFTRIKNDTVYLHMKIKELQQGDFQVMYNTYFYGNSTVMRDQSKYELDKLYNIMNSKPDMRIKLHGHTNGNSRGVAYLFKEEGKNYFEILRTKKYTKKGVSSKKLSAYRAETIKSYLVDHGIESERIETKGWGGKKLLYETDSPMAKNNIRVEIEVLKK